MFKVGDTVRFIDSLKHEDDSQFYPPAGVIGIVQRVDSNGDLWVQWPSGSTSGSDRWCTSPIRVELAAPTEVTP